MSEEEDVPEGREHPLFVVAVWGTIILVFVTLFAFAYAFNPDTHKPPPSPRPWSCASILAEIAPVDGGGQIAPVCGQTPYPSAGD